MKQYSKYKNSGIDWLGNIPEHWEVKRVKDVFKNLDYLREPIAADMREQNNPIYDYYGASGVIDKIDHYNVDDTVLLVSEDGANLLSRNLPLVYKANGKIWVNNHAHILKPINANYDFMFYALENLDYGVYITGSAQPKLSQDNLNRQWVQFPPYPEQTAIAAYLDEKTAAIDRRIELLRNKIDNYKQLRRSLISQVVTRGLNPDVKLKNSGIKWLGDVPEHWEVKRVKDVVSSNQDAIKMGPFGSSLTDRVTYDGKYKIYGQWNVVGKDFSAGKNYVDEQGYKDLINFQVKSGEILISMMGTIGKCATIPDNIQSGIMDSHIIKISLNKQIINNRFYEYVYDKDNSNIVKQQLDKIKRGSIMDGLNSSIVKNLLIPIPPLTEQTAIAAYLDDKTAQIDAIVEKCEMQIEKLSELRRSLIAEAVTGQIKVC